MTENPKVWIRKRKLTNGKTSFHLRWIEPNVGGTRSRKVGTDGKVAEREAALLEEKLRTGTYRSVRRVSWDEFKSNHVAMIEGDANRECAEFALRQFGEVCKPSGPHAVRYGDVERYIAFLRKKGRAIATRNQHLRYLKAAFRAAIRRGVCAADPMDGIRFEREDKKKIRVVSKDEESALLTAATDLYGLEMQAFIVVSLRTGARRGELLSLRWSNVDLDQMEVTFVMTKGRKDRVVPLTPDAVDMLRSMMMKTLEAGGPWRAKKVQSLRIAWDCIRKRAGLTDVTMHDLRRTYVTRLVRADVQMDVVQALAGHASLHTTMMYYTKTTDADKRAAVAKMMAAAV